MNQIHKHLIDDFPFVSQVNDSYCFYASTTMLFRYYGIDFDLYEVMHHCGVGHSLATHPLIFCPPFLPVFLPSVAPLIDDGLTVSQGKKDIKFLCELFGLKCKYFQSSHFSSKEKKWNVYWNYLKKNIMNNVPVFTWVDCLAWTIFRESWNIEKKPGFIRGGHAVIIVGFDEDNKVVYFNDPYDFRGEKEIGRYERISIDEFRNAVSRAYGFIDDLSYKIMIFEKKTEPLSNEEIHQKVFQRNIRKLKGDPDAYDEIYQKAFSCFGIEALKMYRGDLSKMKDNWKYIFYKFLSYLKYPSKPFENLFILAHECSFARAHIAEYCSRYSVDYPKYHQLVNLLNIESYLWKEHAELFVQFDTFIKNSRIKKILELSPIFLEKIINSVDLIIETENNIIKIK